MAEAISAGGISIRIDRKRIKRAYLRADAAGARISAPLHMPADLLQRFALANLDWIRSRLAAEALDIPSSQPIWGENLPIIHAIGPKPSLKLNGEALVLRAPAHPCHAAWLALRSALLRSLVLEAAPPLLEQWQRRLELGPISWETRRMKRRWGTCYPDKRKILLNSELAAMPRPCLELVIAHELNHLFERGHGAGFIQRMDACLPDWRAVHKLLSWPSHGAH